MSHGSRTFDGVEYAPGSRFRVAAEGVTLSGLVPDGPSCWRGWKQALAVGDVVTCTGYGAGFGSDPGYGVHFTSERSLAEHAGFCALRPGAGNMFSYRPQPGLLEPLAG
jgi:hypothetical protein